VIHKLSPPAAQLRKTFRRLSRQYTCAFSYFEASIRLVHTTECRCVLTRIPMKRNRIAVPQYERIENLWAPGFLTLRKRLRDLPDWH
jgi:hypothetical protein